MNETDLGFSFLFFFKKKISRQLGLGEKSAVWKGKTPVADCAPAGRGRGWTTPLGALSSGKDEPSITCWKSGLFSPSLGSFLGLSVTRNGLTFWIISMVTHFHQGEGHMQD